MRTLITSSRYISAATFFLASFLITASQANAIEPVAPAGGGLENPVIGTWGQNPAAASSGATFTTIIVHFWNVLIQVGALAVLLYFLWGAIEWITSGGEKGKLESARNRMLHAALGLLILVSMLIIINFISFLLFGDQFNILRPTFPTPGGATVQPPAKHTFIG